MPKLLIIGAGAQARMVINIVRLSGAAEIAGLIDTFDNPKMWGQLVLGEKVLGNLTVLEKLPPADDLRVIMAVANLARKKEIAAQLTARGYTFMTVRHPSALAAPSVRIGEGCIIHTGVIIEDGAQIGNHVIIHAGAVMEHDLVLEDFVNIGTAVKTSGRVHFCEGATAFTGSVIVPDITIGREAVVGAGAVIFQDVPAGQVMMGFPARALRRNS